MPRLRWFLLLPVLLCALLAGCGSAPAGTGVAPAAAVAPVAPVALTTAAPGDVALTGDVKSPTVLTPASLARFPQRSVPVTYRAGTALEAHVFRGALLADVLPPTALADAPGKNPFLSFAVLGIGADRYSALVAYGEISPDFANTKILIATVQDGRPLATPRLVVPGDGKGGRYVSDLVELKVVRVAP